MTSHPVPPITGYKPLSQAQVDLMNRIKNQEEETAGILSRMMGSADSDKAKRWIAVARTHLETGYMYACKAVAQPTGGLGDSQ